MKKNIRNMLIAVVVMTMLAVFALPVLGPGSAKASQADEKVYELALSLNVDADAIGQVVTMTGGNPNGMDQIMKPITAIISNLKLRALLDSRKIAQVDMILKDTVLATVGAKVDEDNTATIVTDLLPNYAIKADLSKLNQANVGTIKLDEEEQKAIAAAIAAKVVKYRADLSAKMGDAENGSWEFDGATFSEKRPVNITVKEYSLMSLNLVKDLLADPAMKKITDAVAEKVDISKIDEAIANVEKKDDADFPSLTWYSYTNAEGSQYNELALEKAEPTSQKVNCSYSLIGRKFALHADIDANGKGTIEGLIDIDNLTFSVIADVNANNIVAKIVAELVAQKEGSFTGTVSMSMNGNQVLGVSLTGKPSDEQLTIALDGESMKVVPVEALSDGSSEESKQLTTSLQLSLPGILQKAMQAMPEEISTLFALFGGGMQ